METPDLTNVLEADGRLQSAVDADAAGHFRSASIAIGGLLAQHRFAHEAVLFPALAVRCDSIQSLVDELESDHRELDALARAITGDGGDAKSAVAQLRARLARHLDVEHRDVLPLFYRHFDADEFAALDAVINKHRQENRT